MSFTVVVGVSVCLSIGWLFGFLRWFCLIGLLGVFVCLGYFWVLFCYCCSSFGEQNASQTNHMFVRMEHKTGHLRVFTLMLCCCFYCALLECVVV